MVTLPSVHINGTPKQSLFDDNMTALEAIDAAMLAVQKAAPHGRDYYVQDGEAYKAALAEHTARITKLNSVRRELLQIVEHLL